ncbi:ergothioneine biosynthesis glutamate--cysteine ligase EgtA [Glycomyces halotolerans]
MSGDLTEEEAEDYIGGHCFTAARPGRIGVELEWLVRHAHDRSAPISPEASRAAVAPLEAAGSLPGGGRVTREPGGQVELSTSPAASLAECVADAEADMVPIRAALASRGLVLEGGGLDSCRSPRRLLDDRRYRAMEAYFNGNRAGTAMMCSTASVQVNLDAGEEHGVFGYRRRWELAHRLGPVLTAAFANSALMRGRPTGWKSTRQALWGRLDPGRTRPVPDGDEPHRAWTAYALDAPVLCLRRDPPQEWDAPAGLTFRSWLRGDCAEREPTVEDLQYHLGTLFPPVRPKGWLELRMIDAQDTGDWVVPVALCSMLFDDPKATIAAWEATEPLADGRAPHWRSWRLAARIGLDDPVVREAAQACFEAAAEALHRSDAPARVRDAVADYALRYPARGRCPADGQLDTAPPPRRPLPTDQEVTP